jgi:hypothetical protein
MSVLAIVSKAEFEKAVASPTLGALWKTATYASRNPALEPLRKGGDLYLVTARPGDRLWLVAILRAPKQGAAGWTANPNVAPIVDASPIVKKLRFTNDKGLVSAPGKLGMSLQAPRQLTDGDIALLEALTGNGNKTLRSPKHDGNVTAVKAAKEPAVKAPATKKPKVGSGPLVIESRDLAALQSTLHERPEALDIVLTDAAVQLPLVMDLLEQTGPHTATSLRLAMQGFDVVRSEAPTRDAVKKPPRLDEALPNLERLMLEVRAVPEPRPSAADGPGDDRHVDRRSVAEERPTRVAVAPLDLPNRHARCGDRRGCRPADLHEGAVPQARRDRLLQGRCRQRGDSRRAARSHRERGLEAPRPHPPPRANAAHHPARAAGREASAACPQAAPAIEPGYAARSLDTSDFVQNRAHVLVGRESDANVGQLARYLRDARPVGIERVHIEIDPDARVKAGALTVLATALAGLPDLHWLSTRSTPVAATALAGLSRSPA